MQYSYYVIVISDSPVMQAYYKFMDYLSLFGFNVMPILILFILNVKLIITLRRVVDQDISRNTNGDIYLNSIQGNQGPILVSNNEANSHRLNANAMLFAVVAMLFICVGPQAPARILYEFYGQYHRTAVVYTCITQLLVFLNASLNFCLYCLVSKRYRDLLRESIRQVFSEKSECCTSTGIQVKTKFTSLPSPSSTEDHPMLDRRNSA
uniref:G-protein coupled receptors family 1 profile domain-containing protein n=1 Tax=Acrobeloides nanus TaxID=290746 RepID=A0A914DA75_9BILA